MSHDTVLCPHCVRTPMVPRTNHAGGVYLECMDCGYYDSVKAQRNVKRPIDVRKAKRGPRPKMTESEALRLLRRECVRLGRTPKVREIGGIGSLCPNEAWYRDHFGSIAKAFEAAGIERRGRGNPTGKNNRGRAA